VVGARAVASLRTPLERINLIGTKVFELDGVADAVSYPWTRVPERVPPIDKLQLRLLPLADLFMGLMWSRPAGLSLRSTWVTPATIGLGLGIVALAAPAAVAALFYGVRSSQLLLLGLGAACGSFAIGAGTVSLYGIRQRVIERQRRG
jgi:hypothetical protein